jgi:hypothetical protein
MAGYSPDVIRDFVARFGSIAKAEERARSVPGFAEEIDRVENEIGYLSTLLSPPPHARAELEDERRRLIVEALADPPTETLAVDGETAKAHPRHRPPAQIPVDTVKDLKWQLAQRQKELAQRKPRGKREYTQEKIAESLGLDDTRVQQAEALQHRGWDLLRTHPDFSVDEGFVRWPGPQEAARLLASESAEN